MKGESERLSTGGSREEGKGHRKRDRQPRPVNGLKRQLMGERGGHHQDGESGIYKTKIGGKNHPKIQGE